MSLTWNDLFSSRMSTRMYGLGAVVLGLTGLVWGDYAVVWDPAPGDAPGLSVVGYATAISFVIAGLALQWQRGARFGALALTALYVLGALALHIGRVIAHPTVFVTYEDAAEQFALIAGGLIAYALCVQPATRATERIITIARFMFAACLLIFGLAHLFYAAQTASMVPAWLPPSQMFWTYATAACHIAAGIAILCGFAARAASGLLTVMFTGFALLVHAPAVISGPHTHYNWSENAINFALIGCAWVIASSFTKNHSMRRETKVRRA